MPTGSFISIPAGPCPVVDCLIAILNCLAHWYAISFLFQYSLSFGAPNSLSFDINHIGKLYVSLIWRGRNTMRNVPRRMELRAWWWYTSVYTSGVPNRLPPPNPPCGPPTPLSTTTWTYPSVIRAPLPHQQPKWDVEPTAIHEKTERRCDGAHHERIKHGSWNREQV